MTCQFHLPESTTLSPRNSSYKVLLRNRCSLATLCPGCGHWALGSGWEDTPPQGSAGNSSTGPGTAQGDSVQQLQHHCTGLPLPCLTSQHPEANLTLCLRFKWKFGERNLIYSFSHQQPFKTDKSINSSLSVLFVMKRISRIENNTRSESEKEKRKHGGHLTSYGDMVRSA